MKVAAYYRVSTSKQAETELSIPEQQRQARAYCASKGWTIVREFEEPGDSASDELRPVYQEMLAWVEGKAHPVDAIVVYSFSRFMRDGMTLEFRVRSLRQIKVELVSVTQHLEKNPTGDFLRQMLGAFDEYANRENAKHTLSGMRSNAEAGYWNGSKPPYGYRTCDAGMMGIRQKKRLEIDPDEAPIIRLIFELALKGEGVKNIAVHLNGRGIRHRGKKFHTGYVHRILRHETYAGTHYFNLVCAKTRESKPPSEWVAMTVPAIIDEADYKRVQASLTARSPKKVAPRIVNGPTLLTGIAKCPHCSSGMMLRTGKGGRYRYYTCATAARMGKEACQGRSIRMDLLDDLVIKAFAKQVMAPKRLKELLGEIIDQGAVNDQQRQRKMDDLQRATKEAQAVVDRLYDALEKGVLDLNDPEAGGRISAAKLRRDEAKSDFEAIRTLVNTKPEVTTERIERFAKLLRDNLDAEDVTFRKNWLGLFVDEIVVDDEEIIMRGSTAALAEAVNGTDGQNLPMVPTFVRKWRPHGEGTPSKRVGRKNAGFGRFPIAFTTQFSHNPSHTASHIQRMASPCLAAITLSKRATTTIFGGVSRRA